MYISSSNYHCLLDLRYLEKGKLDFFRVDAVSPNLELEVFAPNIFETAVGPNTAKISCTEDASISFGHIAEKCGVRERLILPVTLKQISAPNSDFPNGIQPYFLVRFIQYENVHILDRIANRQCCIWKVCFLIDEVHPIGKSFSAGENMKQDSVGEILFKQIHVVFRDHSTAQFYESEIGKSLLSCN